MTKKQIGIEPTDAEKCCKVVEFLVSDDFCESLEFRIGVHKDYKIAENEAKLINKKFTMIYTFTHATNKHGCQASHEDWLADMRKTYDKMKRRGGF
jgi:hypothetical protein